VSRTKNGTRRYSDGFRVVGLSAFVAALRGALHKSRTGKPFASPTCMGAAQHFAGDLSDSFSCYVFCGHVDSLLVWLNCMVNKSSRHRPIPLPGGAYLHRQDSRLLKNTCAVGYEEVGLLQASNILYPRPTAPPRVVGLTHLGHFPSIRLIRQGLSSLGAGLFVFGSFADDAQSVLAAVLRFALVGIKHGPDFSFGCIQRIGTRMELSVTSETNAESVAGSFWNYPQFSFGHEKSLAQMERSVMPVDFKRHHYRGMQGHNRLGVLSDNVWL
jgi:hypothetical protein